MGKKANNKSKLTRCIKAPFRVLCKVRDFYVRSMTNCAGRTSYGYVAHVSNLPRSFNVSLSRLRDEDRLARMKMRMDQEQLIQVATGALGMPRIQSVAIGRIVEDIYMPGDFPDDFLRLKTNFLYPRSRSYAFTKRTGILA